MLKRRKEVDCCAPEPEVWSFLGPVPELEVGSVSRYHLG